MITTLRSSKEANQKTQRPKKCRKKIKDLSNNTEVVHPTPRQPRMNAV